MEKIYVHIGLSLFAIMKLCEKQATCTNCPLWGFCKSTYSIDCPNGWDSGTIPNVAVVLELTNGDASDTMKLVPQIEQSYRVRPDVLTAGS